MAKDVVTEMTIKEAYHILRRFEDCRDGWDKRFYIEAFPDGGVHEAITLILESQGLSKPLTNCGCCKHHSAMMACHLHVIGECTEFERGTCGPVLDIVHIKED